jgi:hypothetical protein
MNVIATPLIAAAAMAGAPIGASVLVSIASRREDAAGTLRRKAPGVIAIAARRILDFHSEYDAPPARPGRSGRATRIPAGDAATRNRC